jgi:O-antigen/teichoic acid export membrane protein
MKRLFNQAVNHPLIAGSGIVFAGSFFANLLNYIFNLSMGRLLSAPDYGLLASLSSFLALFGVFQVSFSNTLARFSAVFFAKGDRRSLALLLLEGGRLVALVSSIFLILLFAFSFFISSFLNIKNIFLVFLVNLVIFVSLISSVPFGILQGQMRFMLISLLNIAQTFLKLVLGIGFVFLGYSVFGAFFGIFLSAIFIFLTAFFLIVRSDGFGLFAKENSSRVLREEILGFWKGVFFASLGMTILGNTDTILVRHFFSEVQSGQYAALSLMGKSIFYFTSPLYFAFFPLIAKKQANKERLFGTLMLGILLVSAASIGLSFVYFVFSNLVLRIFFPADVYKPLASYLGIFSLYILVFSLASLLSNFFLSTGKLFVYRVTLLFAVLQIVLIFFLHSSFYQVIGALFLSSFLLLFFFLVYYAKYAKD